MSAFFYLSINKIVIPAFDAVEMTPVEERPFNGRVKEQIMGPF